jgi:hypothetical protein
MMVSCLRLDLVRGEMEGKGAGWVHREKEHNEAAIRGEDQRSAINNQESGTRDEERGTQAAATTEEGEISRAQQINGCYGPIGGRRGHKGHGLARWGAVCSCHLGMTVTVTETETGHCG